MAKNMNGDGTVTWNKSRNRYQAVVTATSGKRVYRYAKTKTEANNIRRDLLELNKTTDIGDTTKVADYLIKHYLPTKKYKKPSTYNHYKFIIEKYLVNLFPYNYMATLSADTIKDKWQEMDSNNKSASLINHCHSVLSAAFNSAIPKIRTTNPCDEVRKKGWVPTVSAKKIRPLTNEEMRTLLKESASRTEYYPIIRFASVTGMRRGELCALTWRDIDWDNSRIKVVHSAYQEQNGITYIGTTKNDEGRNIHIEPETVEFLKDHREMLKGNGLLYGYKVNLDSHIFLNRLTGTNMLTEAVSHGFRRLTKQIGLKGTHFHDLRHTFASNLLDRNVPPKVVQEILGHKTIAITMDIYGHLMATSQANALEGFKLPEHL